jgi:hypothetical protein
LVGRPGRSTLDLVDIARLTLLVRDENMNADQTENEFLGMRSTDVVVEPRTHANMPPCL